MPPNNCAGATCRIPETLSRLNVTELHKLSKCVAAVSFVAANLPRQLKALQYHDVMLNVAKEKG